MSLLLTLTYFLLCPGISMVNFEQVNTGWVRMITVQLCGHYLLKVISKDSGIDDKNLEIPLSLKPH